MPRLGTTSASLKLKGIDGGPHKQRSVWFNSTRHAEPYQGLTCTCKRQRCRPLVRGTYTDAAWLSSARAVRCWVKSRNERNPCCQLNFSDETAEDNSEEGGDDVKSARLLRPGLHTRYNGRYRGLRSREAEPILKTVLSSDCRLQLACMKSELLVTASQHIAVNMFPGLVHTARQVMKAGNT